MYNKAEYDRAFTKANYYTVTIRLSKVRDLDIIERLEEIKAHDYTSKQSYIKSLIRQDRNQYTRSDNW